MPLRLLRADVPAWVRARLAGPPGTRWVGVDGFGAAGKTTLALAIAAAVPGSVVVPVDDFARPDLTTWERDRFVAEVLGPLRAGRPGRYRPADLLTGELGGWRAVPAGVPVVVEGVSATDSRLGVPWDLTIWLEVPDAVRRRRITARDSPELLERWRTDWWPAEQAYAVDQQPRDRVDAIVDGSSSA